MAQPDLLSLTLRDFITLSQLCFLSHLFLDHLIQQHQTEDAQAHTMPDACKIMIKLGFNLPESARLGLCQELLNELDWAGIEPATICFPGQTLYH